MKRQSDLSKARRGQVEPSIPGKTRITIRLENDVIKYFRTMVNRAAGGNYQALINDALGEYIRGARSKKIVRQSVREEVKAVGEALSPNNVKRGKILVSVSSEARRVKLE